MITLPQLITKRRKADMKTALLKDLLTKGVVALFFLLGITFLTRGILRADHISSLIIISAVFLFFCFSMLKYSDWTRIIAFLTTLFGSAGICVIAIIFGENMFGVYILPYVYAIGFANLFAIAKAGEGNTSRILILEFFATFQLISAIVISSFFF